jgi:hypothetical protein
MEARVAKVYRSDILAPTAFDFLQLYLKEARLGKLAACRAHYYCERAVQVRFPALMFKKKRSVEPSV